MDWMRTIAEEKIVEAIRDGIFDQLPGKGKPLEMEDDSRVPAELRASYRVLKNAGVLPEELQLRKEMVTLQQLLACCRDEEERARWNRELSAKQLRYQALMGERGWLSSVAYARYEERIQEKLMDGSRSAEAGTDAGKTDAGKTDAMTQSATADAGNDKEG